MFTKGPDIYEPLLMDFSFGRYHSLFLDEIGHVYGCGMLYRNTGLGNSIENIADAKNIQYISCCGYSSFLLNNDNHLYVFGSNIQGQLAINDKSTQSVSYIKLALKNVTQFSCGFHHIGCLLANNELYMYGWNVYHQCGVFKMENCHKGNIK